jgi:predicted hydrocarbon binding protein
MSLTTPKERFTAQCARGIRAPNHRSCRPCAAPEVVYLYIPRKVCALAIGIGKGLAAYYFHENITSIQTVCIHKGAPKCEIVFRKIR